MKPGIQSAYLAAEGFVDPLIDEIVGVQSVHANLVLSDRPAKHAVWAQNIWWNPVQIPIQSISDGARKLKKIQRNWCLYSTHLHRRATLIQEQLPHVSAKALSFPAVLPESPLGAWTLLDEDKILAASKCSSLFPNGEVKFIEDREGPPSRAYLKLYEALTLIQKHPQKGQFCIDAGGSPGGWAWVVGRLGADVLSVDRSPLDPRVAAIPNIQFEQGNAFNLTPDGFDSVDWLFCDVICYPEKLYRWIKDWADSGVCRNMLCTIKFQGSSDYSIVQEFSSIPESRVVHLYHNKNELTWIKIDPAENQPEE